MKRIIALVLIIAMCFPLGACSIVFNKTKLTLDNFDKYLKINYVCEGTGDSVTDRNSIVCFPEILIGFSVAGASPNFNYNDIVIEIEFSGTYGAFEKYLYNPEPVNNTFNITITVETDIAGNGEYFETIKLTEGLYTRNTLISYNMSINVSGNVTPAW